MLISVPTSSQNYPSVLLRYWNMMYRFFILAVVETTEIRNKTKNVNKHLLVKKKKIIFCLLDVLLMHFCN